MSDDLDRLMAALTLPGDDALNKRGRGRPPALTQAQVRSIRRRRALPIGERPRQTELAAEFRVDVVTIRKALQARPPYDFGEPVDHGGGPHRDRGSARFWDDLL